MFLGHGSEQIFIRGCVQGMGVPIEILREIVRLTVLDVFWLERSQVLIVAMFLRCIITAASAYTLFAQWWLTGKGATGHPTSDQWERLMDPTVDCPLECIKVTIVSAQGLRNADWTGKSDPYCTVTVSGNMSSTFKTRVINDALNPVWNELHEMPGYRKHDMLEIAVYDYDDKGRCSFNWNDDFLGSVTVPSELFHPDGFEGDLHLNKCGFGKAAMLRVKIEKPEELTDRLTAKSSTRHRVVDIESSTPEPQAEPEPRPYDQAFGKVIYSL
jgi:hypothetical protein